MLMMVSSAILTGDQDVDRDDNAVLNDAVLGNQDVDTVLNAAILGDKDADGGGRAVHVVVAALPVLHSSPVRLAQHQLVSRCIINSYIQTRSTVKRYM